jgi:hypothetical protein
MTHAACLGQLALIMCDADNLEFECDACS